jgi:hypothetical protein
MAGDSSQAECPELRLAQQVFLLSTTDVSCDRNALSAALRQDIFENGPSLLLSCPLQVSPREPDSLPSATAAPARLPLYMLSYERLGWPVDEAKTEEMRAKNEQTLKELDDRCAATGSQPARRHPAAVLCTLVFSRPKSRRRITDAEANLGESEVREALLAKANFYVKIGDKARCTQESPSRLCCARS